MSYPMWSERAGGVASDAQSYVTCYSWGQPYFFFAWIPNSRGELISTVSKFVLTSIYYQQYYILSARNEPKITASHCAGCLVFKTFRWLKQMGSIGDCSLVRDLSRLVSYNYRFPCSTYADNQLYWSSLSQILHSSVKQFDSSENRLWCRHSIASSKNDQVQRVIVFGVLWFCCI